MSAAPPGGKPTTRRIGLSGYFWAFTGLMPTSIAISANAADTAPWRFFEIRRVLAITY
jgi:hypothetical protein